jgi:type III secretion protein U
MAKNDDGLKKHPATLHKMQQLRRKEGQVPRSRDFPSAISMIAVFCYLFLSWRSIIDNLQRLFDPLSFAAGSQLGDAFAPALTQSTLLFGKLAAPVAAVAIVSYILASLIDSKGLVVSIKHVTPNPERLNPATNLKNIIGLQALVQLGKTLFKAIMFVAIVVVIVRYALNSAVWAPVCGEACARDVAIQVIAAIIIAALVLLLVVALADLLISRAVFAQENRMTDQELKQERREQFGDPEMNKERKRIRNEAAKSGGYRGFGRATVLVESAEGAIGLAYVPGEIDTPVVVVKATGEAYTSLRFQAEGKGVPIIRDDQLMEQLNKYGRVGEAIPKAMFNNVATMLVRSGLIK